MTITYKEPQVTCNSIACWAMVGLFAVFPVFLGLSNVLLAVMFGFWLFAGRFKEQFNRLKQNPLSMPVLLIFLWVLFAISWSPASASEITNTLGKYSKLLLVFVLIGLLREPLWQRRCWYAFTAGMLFVVASVYANVFLQLPWSKTNNQGWGVDHTVAGTYITQNIMMAFFVVLCVMNVLNAQLRQLKAFWALASLLSSVTILQLTGGRTGFVLIIVALSFFAYSRWLSKLKLSKRLLAMLFGIFAVVVLVQTTPQLHKRFELAFSEIQQYENNSHSSMGVRTMLVHKSGVLWAQSPILGHGTGAYHQAICDVLPKNTDCRYYSLHPESQFNLFAIEHGLIGLGLFFWLLLAIYQSCKKLPLNERALCIGFLSIFIVSSLFNSSLFSARENHFFIFMMALLATNARTKLISSKYV
jgi:O-antigen ligase